METISEDYVSDETFKILKEKGVDDSCCRFVVESEETYHRGAPTLQMAMKWLREVQGLNIYVRAVWKDVEVQYGNRKPAVVGYDWFVESLLDDTYSKMSIEPSLTYEEASEAAIKYCLENLI